jgi:putative two-component system response regulator
MTESRQFMSDKAKILVVDDQMAVALMMVFLLERAGCDTQTALNAEKALRLAQTGTFDLITLDVDMPGINGFELFLRLKQIPHLAETPIVFVSGNSTIENQQRGLDLGASDFIEKPFDARAFISRILSCIKPTAQSESQPSDVPDENADADTQRLCNTP